MKKTLLISISLCGASLGLAQATNVINSTGNIGVGTTSPNAALEIYRSAGITPSLLRLSTGFAAGNTVDFNPFIAGVSNSGFELLVGGTRRMVVDSNGRIGLGTNAPSYGLDVAGAMRSGAGILNTTNYFEKVLPSIGFPNEVANQAVDLRLGNVSFWGYIEVEITSTYSYQNSSGKLTKVFAVGVNPGNNLYTNESRVSDAMGTITDNISIGDLVWDSAVSTYKIPISHIVSTQNTYTVKVRMFTDASGAAFVFDQLSESALYTLNALPRNYVYFNGNVGVGTASPQSKFSVQADNGALWDNGQFLISGQSNSNKRVSLGFDTSNNFGFVQALIAGENYYNLVLNPHGGNVGIGTTNPTQKLSVNGTIRAKEVIVETTGWSDYVLAKNYALAPLSEVEKHIKNEGHLPGIPSAEEVAEKGVGVGEMQAKLLAKVEELTLHLIEQQKRIEHLTEQNTELSNRVKAVEGR